MKRAIRCLVLLLAVAGVGCATDYTKRYRRAHPDWTPGPPAAGDSVEKLLASLHAGSGGPREVSLRELRILRVDMDPWQEISAEAAVAGSGGQTLGVIALRSCTERQGLRFTRSERTAWYIFAAGKLVSYDHFEFGAECEPEDHYLPSREEYLTIEHGLLRYALRRHPESAPTTAERLSKGMALVAAERLPEAERMLRRADRDLDFMTTAGKKLSEEEIEAFEAKQKKLRRMRARLSRAIADARRQQREASD